MSPERERDAAAAAEAETARRPASPTPQQAKWLARGLDQPGGKLPLFDHQGQRISERTVRSCIRNGWAEPWFANPLKPDWQVCKLTDRGRRLVQDGGPSAETDTETEGATVHQLHA